MFFHAPWNRIRVAHRIELLFDLLANDTLFTASPRRGCSYIRSDTTPMAPYFALALTSLG